MGMHVLDEDEEISIAGWDAEEFALRALSSRTSLAAVIEATLLQPEATRANIVRLCAEAAEHRFGCVLVNPVWAGLAVAELAGTGVPVGSVVGFPLGASLGTSKRDEAAALVKLGVRDVEMVLSVGQLKCGENAAVQNDIGGVVDVAHEAGAAATVILETCLLTVEEKLRATELAVAAGADFLKTSTGFFAEGAQVDEVAFLRGVAGGRCGVKACDGIRTLADVHRMLEAGANRLGTGAGAGLLAELDPS